MMYVILIESLLYFFCVYTILNDVYGYFPKNNKLIYCFPIIYIPFIIFQLITGRDISDLAFVTANLLAIFSLKYIFINSKIRSIISTYICLYSINIVITSTIVFTVNIPYHDSIKSIISFIINLILTFGFTLLCKSKRSNIKNIFVLIPINVKRITLLSLVLSTFVISLISEFSTFESIENWNIIIRISLLLLITFIGAAFPILIANSIGKSFYYKQSNNFEQQIQAQAKHYEALSKSNYELRRFRHDYDNMRIGVSKLIKDGKIKDTLKMLNDCDNDLNAITNEIIKFDTGNGIIDALLSEKQKKATTVNTVITFDGTVPINMIAATDLCVIFGNTIDNAIEACEVIATDKEKTITITCKCGSGFMFLKITNPVAKNVQIHNNSILTTKSNKDAHGFGLYSLDKIISKYDGDLVLMCDNKQFSVNIDLNLNI